MEIPVDLKKIYQTGRIYGELGFEKLQALLFQLADHQKRIRRQIERGDFLTGCLLWPAALLLLATVITFPMIVFKVQKAPHWIAYVFWSGSIALAVIWASAFVKLRRRRKIDFIRDYIPIGLFLKDIASRLHPDSNINLEMNITGPLTAKMVGERSSLAGMKGHETTRTFKDEWCRISFKLSDGGIFRMESVNHFIHYAYYIRHSDTDTHTIESWVKKTEVTAEYRPLQSHHRLNRKVIDHLAKTEKIDWPKGFSRPEKKTENRLLECTLTRTFHFEARHDSQEGRGFDVYRNILDQMPASSDYHDMFRILESCFEKKRPS